MNTIKEKWLRFWQQDMDTILYTLMCFANVIGLAAGLSYLWAVKYFLPPGVQVCTLYGTTGLYCPGCGGTRAFMALFHGNILAAFYYHPAAMYGVFFYLTYFISQTLMRISKGKVKGLKMRPLYLYIMLALVVLNFVIRNALLLIWNISTL